MDTVKSNIVGRIKPYLDAAGMYYRIFARVKSKDSIRRKLESKGNEYRLKNKKMQDLIGVRIVFYFQEDVHIFHNKLKQLEGYDLTGESSTKKELNDLSELINSWNNESMEDKIKLKKLLPFHDKVFMPERLNIIMKMSKNESDMIGSILCTYSDIDVELIDHTFEIQLRTVLSEGWHEVEHDLRYKTRAEEWWNFCKEESRMLNGIYASLETNENALSQLIDELTYKNFKNKSWDAMIRFHFRRRTAENKLSEELCCILDNDLESAKQILHITREKLVILLWNLRSPIEISTDLILFLINREVIENDKIRQLETDAITSILNAKSKNF